VVSGVVERGGSARWGRARDHGGRAAPGRPTPLSTTHHSHPQASPTWRVTGACAGSITVAAPLASLAADPVQVSLDELVVTLAPREGRGSGGGAAGAAPTPAARSNDDGAPPSPSPSPSGPAADGVRLVASGIESVLHRVMVVATRVAVRVELPPGEGPAAAAARDGVALLLRASEVTLAGDAPVPSPGGSTSLTKRVSVVGLTAEVAARRGRHAARATPPSSPSSASSHNDDELACVLLGGRGAAGVGGSLTATLERGVSGGRAAALTVDASLDAASLRVGARSLALLEAAAEAWPKGGGASVPPRPSPRPSPALDSTASSDDAFFDCASDMASSSASIASFLAGAARAVTGVGAEERARDPSPPPTWTLRLALAGVECVLFYDETPAGPPPARGGVGGRPRLALAVGAADGRATGSGAAAFDARLAVYDVRASDLAPKGRAGSGRARRDARALTTARAAPGVLPPLEAGTRPPHASLARRRVMRPASAGAGPRRRTVASLAAAAGAAPTSLSDSEPDSDLNEWPLLAVAGGGRGGAPALELRAQRGRARGPLAATAHARAATLWLSLPLVQRVATALAPSPAAVEREAAPRGPRAPAPTPASASIHLPRVTTVLMLPEEEGDDDEDEDHPPHHPHVALAVDLEAPRPRTSGDPTPPTLAATARPGGGWDARLRVGRAAAFLVGAPPGVSDDDGGSGAWSTAFPPLAAFRVADALDSVVADVGWRPGAAPAGGELAAAARDRAAAHAASPSTAAAFDDDAASLSGVSIRVHAADVRLALAPADVAALAGGAAAVSAAAAAAGAAAAAAAAAAGAPPPPPPPPAFLEVRAAVTVRLLPSSVPDDGAGGRGGAAFVAAARGAVLTAVAPLGEGGVAFRLKVEQASLTEQEEGAEHALPLVWWPTATPATTADDDAPSLQGLDVVLTALPDRSLAASMASAGVGVAAPGCDPALPWARRAAAWFGGGGPTSADAEPRHLQWWLAATDSVLRLEPDDSAGVAAALLLGSVAAAGGDDTSLTVRDIALLLADGAGAPGAWAAPRAPIAAALATGGYATLATEDEIAATMSTADDGARDVAVAQAAARVTLSAGSAAAVAALARQVAAAGEGPPHEPPPPPSLRTSVLCGVVEHAFDAPPQRARPASATDGGWQAVDPGPPSPPSPPPDEAGGAWLAGWGVRVVDDFVRVGGERGEGSAPAALPKPGRAPETRLVFTGSGVTIGLHCPRGGAGGGGRALDVRADGARAEWASWADDGATSGPVLLTRLTVTVQDACLRDLDAAGAEWGTVVGKRASTAVSASPHRPSSTPMLRLHLETLRPTLGAAPEARLTIAPPPPLRARVDQDVAAALSSLAMQPGPELAFGEDDLVLESDESGSGSESDGDAVGLALPLPPPATTTATTISSIFFQRASLPRLDLVLDYRPRRLDVGALAAGRLAELVNAAPLDGVALALPAVVVRGAAGVGGLRARVATSWWAALRDRGPRALLAGFPAARAVSRVADPAGDLLRLPADALRGVSHGGSRTRLPPSARRARRSLTRLVRATLAEALGAGSGALGGCRVVVEGGGSTRVRAAVGAAVGAAADAAAGAAAELRR